MLCAKVIISFCLILITFGAAVLCAKVVLAESYSVTSTFMAAVWENSHLYFILIQFCCFRTSQEAFLHNPLHVRSMVSDQRTCSVLS